MGDNRTSEKRSWANDEGETSQENPAAASSSTRLPEKLEECIRDFSSFKDPSKIDDLIRMIKELLQTSQQPDNASTSSQVTGKIDEKRSMLTCFTKSGSKFLKSFNERLEKTGIKKYSKEGTKVATEILQLVGQTHWLVGGLSMIAYLISTTDKMSENRTECLELLGCMIELAERLKSWKNMVPQHEEKFADAIQVIVEGSVTCASQLKSNRFFRFLKASVNSEALGSLRRKISETKDDLVLINCIESLSQRPGDRPITKPDYPDKAGFNLFKDPNKRGTIKFEDLQRVLKICVGIQLALKIVGAQKRGTIKDEKPSECLVDFVYGELHESTQEAFLDICCFFSNWNRQDVEYIVGKEEVASLLETKLITSTPEGNDLDAVFPHSEKLIVDGIIKAKGRSLANGSRIMDVQSLSEVLADKERLPHVKGIWLAEDQSEYVIEGKHLNLMSKSLRVLSLGERMKVSRPSQMKFEELRFLGVGGDNTELLVKSEVFDKLRVFHGPFFVGGEVSLHKLPKSLLAMKVKKQTDGTDCTNSQMTGALPCCLEKLDFSELSELPQLPEGFNQLRVIEIFESRWRVSNAGAA